ncbi:MAG: hypothetical protein ABI665_14090, partial [Vicinamibacterales bacterium]
RLGKRQPGDVSALLATLDAHIVAARDTKMTRAQWSKRAPLYRRYRRAMNRSFSTFTKASVGLEQVRAMSGPLTDEIGRISRKLADAERKAANILPPGELASGHALLRSSWELAQNAFRLRLQSVSTNNLLGAQQASSAAAGALMLYRKAQADLQAVMAQPARQ